MFVWVKLHGPFKDAAPKGCKKKFAVYGNTIREVMSALKQHEELFEALKQHTPEVWIGGDDLDGAYNLTVDQFLNPRTRLQHAATLHITPHVHGGAALPVWAIVAIVTVAVTIAMEIAMSILFPPPQNKDNKTKDRSSILYSGGLNTQKEGVQLGYIAGLDVGCGSNAIEGSVTYPGTASMYVTGGVPTPGGGYRTTYPAPVGSYDPGTGDTFYDTSVYYGGGGGRTLDYLVHSYKGGSSSSSGGNTIADTIHTDGTVNVLLALGDGPVGGIVGSTAEEKEHNIYINQLPLRDAGTGQRNYNGITWDERVGTTGQTQMGITPGTTDNIDGGNIQLKNQLSGGGADYHIFSVTAYDASKVELRIRLPQLVQTDTNGNQTTTSVSIAVDYKRTTDTSWTSYGLITHSGKNSNAVVVTGWLPAPPLKGTDTWEFRLHRTTADSNDDKLQNESYFDGWTEYIDLDYKYDGTEGTATGVPVALLGVSANLQQFGDGRVPEIMARMVGRKVRVPANYDPIARTYATTGPGTAGGVWDGSFQTLATQNPVWHWYHIATSGGSTSPQGCGMADTMFDKFALYNVAQWCDQTVNGRPRYTLNKQFTDETDGWQFLNDLCKSFGAFCYFTGSQVILVADQDQATPDHYVNNTMVDSGYFNYQSVPVGDRINEALVEWDDPDDYFRKKVERYRDTDTITKLRTAGLSNAGIVTETYAKIGCTNRQEAYDFARRIVYLAQHETETIVFTTFPNAAAYAPGQIIAVHDITTSPTTVQGRLVSKASNTLTLDQPFVQAANTAYDLYCVVGNKLVIRSIVQVSSATTTSTVTISDASDIDATLQLPFGIVQHSGGVQPRLYRITDIQDGGDGKYQVTGQFYDRAKYAWIENNVPAPTITYSDYNAVRIVPAVDQSSLAVVWHAHEDPVRGTQHYLEFSWDKVTKDASGNPVIVSTYIAEARMPDGSVRVLSATNQTVAQLQNPPPGPYVFMVTAVNTLGKSSDTVSTTYTLAYGSHGQALNPPTLIGLL